jgi:hypothetical protein
LGVRNVLCYLDFFKLHYPEPHGPVRQVRQKFR